jgi:CheY-like chemotaxis protein
MRPERRTFTILMAEDDDDDRLLTEEALKEAGLESKLDFVKDGAELMDYLTHQGAYSEIGSASRPSIILLDLNMPKKDGREALKEIKGLPSLRRIPVIVFSTSQDRKDIDLAYDLGANSFVCKPNNFDTLVKTLKTLGDYWFELTALPHY